MFIKPNGLEHGEPLVAEVSVLMKLAVDRAEILLACNNGTISGYFMKNFFWYHKITVSGKLFGIEDNAILILQGHSIFKYHVYRETSENFSLMGQTFIIQTSVVHAFLLHFITSKSKLMLKLRGFITIKTCFLLCLKKQ